MAVIVHHCCRIWGTGSGSAAVTAPAEEEQLEPRFGRILKFGGSDSSCADSVAKS